MTHTTKWDTLQLPYCGPQAQVAIVPLRMRRAEQQVEVLQDLPETALYLEARHGLNQR